VESLLYDLRLAWRTLSRRPGMCAVAVASIAAGIAVNVAVFTVFGAILLRPLAVPGQDRLVLVGSPLLTGSQQESLREAMATHGELLGFQMAGALALDDGPQDVPVERVSPNYFTALGLAPAAGSLPREAVARADGEVTVVLSHSLWTRRLGRDPSVVGRMVRLGRMDVRVAAIGPPGFRGLAGPMAADAWLTFPGRRAGDEHASWNALLRVRDGLTPGQARPFLESALRSLPGHGPGQSPADVRVLPLVEMERLIFVLVTVFMAVPGLVLLVACANVSGLLAARADERREEMAVRLALGGARGRLVRQLLTEGALLAGAGAVLGLLGGFWMVEGIAPWLLPALANYALRPELTLDGRAVAVAGGLAVVATLAASLLPALAASRSDLTPLLKRETAGFGVARRVSRRDVLVVGQLVITFAFVVTAVLCSRSFSANLGAPLGFAPDRLLAVPVHSARFEEAAPLVADLEALLDRVRALPGVVRATLASSPPAVRGMEAPVRATDAAGEGVRAAAYRVRAEFFAIGGVRLLRGRLIDETDARFERAVAVVGRSLAERLWPGEDPLGRTLRFGEDPVPLEVIGLVEDPVEVARVEQSAGRRGPPSLFAPLGARAMASTQGAVLLVQGGGAPVAALGPTIATLARDLHPRLVLGGARTVADVNRAGLVQVEITSVTYALLGAFCALLGAVGLYGALAQLVARRTREFGIRRALGAEARQIKALVLRRGATLAGASLALGLPAALAAARVFGSAVPDLPPVDATTLLLGALLVLAVALCASYLPAARATRVDPMVALRHD